MGTFSIQRSNLFSPLASHKGLQEFYFQIHHISILADCYSLGRAECNTKLPLHCFPPTPSLGPPVCTNPRYLGSIKQSFEDFSRELRTYWTNKSQILHTHLLSVLLWAAKVIKSCEPQCSGLSNGHLVLQIAQAVHSSLYPELPRLHFLPSCSAQLVTKSTFFYLTWQHFSNMAEGGGGCENQQLAGAGM